MPHASSTMKKRPPSAEACVITRSLLGKLGGVMEETTIWVETGRVSALAQVPGPSSLPREPVLSEELGTAALFLTQV